MMPRPSNLQPLIRPSRDDELPQLLAIINAAAQRYRGIIPDDRWHDPYMPAEALEREIVAGVRFWGAELDGSLAGVMGIQPVLDVTLIRHAYVAPDHQGLGIGGTLLAALRERTEGAILIGTWAAAEWAIGFYQRHGFALVAPDRTPALLRKYWSIPERQIETSVVLAG